MVVVVVVVLAHVGTPKRGPLNVHACMHVWLVCCIHCVSKKGDTKLLVITLSNLNRFFKNFLLADFLKGILQ